MVIGISLQKLYRDSCQKEAVLLMNSNKTLPKPSTLYPVLLKMHKSPYIKSAVRGLFWSGTRRNPTCTT